MQILISQLQGAVSRCEQLAQTLDEPVRAGLLHHLGAELRFELNELASWTGLDTNKRPLDEEISPLTTSVVAGENERIERDLRASMFEILAEIELEMARLMRANFRGCDDLACECALIIADILRTLGSTPKPMRSSSPLE